MYFENIQYLPIILLFWGGGVLVLLYLLRRENQTTSLSQMSSREDSKVGRNLKYTGLVIIITAMSLALLEPQILDQKYTKTKSGIDIVIALDVSNSMRALDFSTQNQKVDRLTMAKAFITEFVANHPYDRFSLVVFAGESFVVSPLTLDHQLFLTALHQSGYRDVGIQGTDLSEALKESIRRVSIGGEVKRGKAILLITDGDETMTGGLQEVAQVAAQKSIPIISLGIGSKIGVPIPERIDAFGNIQYKKYRGETVLTKINEKPLKEIAKITNGKYFHAKEVSDLTKAEAIINPISKTMLYQTGKIHASPQFQIPISGALIGFLLWAVAPLGRLKSRKKR